MLLIQIAAIYGVDAVVIVSARFSLALAVGIRFGVGDIKLLKVGPGQARRTSIRKVTMANILARAGTDGSKDRNSENE